MKTTFKKHLVEYEEDSKVQQQADYYYRNLFFSREKYRQGLREFEKTSDSKYKALAYFDSMPPPRKDAFQRAFRDELDNVIFDPQHGAVFQGNGTIRIELCTYDEQGAPPWEWDRSMFDITIRNAKTLTEVPDWLPKNIYNLEFLDCGLTNLKNIHKKIDKCSVFSLFDCPVKSHMLGIALLDLRTEHNGVYLSSQIYKEEFEKMEGIFLDALLHGKDVFEVQEIMVKEGLEAFAQL